MTFKNIYPTSNLYTERVTYQLNRKKGLFYNVQIVILEFLLTSYIPIFYSVIPICLILCLLNLAKSLSFFCSSIFFCLCFSYFKCSASSALDLCYNPKIVSTYIILASSGATHVRDKLINTRLRLISTRLHLSVNLIANIVKKLIHL